MATYYAITATGSNFYPLAVTAYDKRTAEEKARALIGDIRTETGTDIYRETKQKNLRIVAKSGLRRFRITQEMVAAAFESVE